MARRAGPVELLDVIVGLGVVWYTLPPDIRREIEMRCWRFAAHRARAAAAGLGRLAIAAEHRYWKAAP